MELLELSQIIFNFTASITAIIIGLAVIMLADRVFRSVRAAEHFFNTLDEKSSQAYKHLSVILAGFSAAPLISMFFKKGKSKKEE